jgi:hypothetical protein
MSTDSDKRLFARVVSHYTNGAMVCSRCGRSDELSIDHVIPRARNPTRDGATDIGRGLWRRLENEGYPEGYTVLCRVCNSAKADSGPIPVDEHGRPILRVLRKRLDRVTRGYETKVEWLRDGDPGYTEELHRRQDKLGAQTVRAPAFKVTSPEVRDLKIRFEAETGIRLPLIGRHDAHGHLRLGWVQCLREFHKVAFYGEGGLKPNLRPFCFEDIETGEAGWEPIGHGGFRCRRCATEGGSDPLVWSENSLATHRCLRWVGREEAVTRLVQSNPHWMNRLRQFVIERLDQPNPSS